MKVTRENIEELPVSIHQKRLLRALLSDIDEINETKLTEPIYINWIDEHTDYSPERIDPCPDFYGLYTLKREDIPSETIGVEMDIDTLDVVICALNNYVTY